MLAISLIYFVNLEDFLVCHNLGITSTLSCASVAHIETYKNEHPIYSIEPDALLQQMNSIQTFLSPRLTQIMHSCWSRHGYKLAIGQDNPTFIPNEQVAKMNRIAEIEIEFEKIRRNVNQSLPSRLMCIYLAEDNYEGRVMLQNMFSKRKAFLVVPVRITSILKFHKADSDWISNYEKNKDSTSILNYWKGIPFSNNPKYEYLLDGEIELVNKEDKENILADYITRHVPDMKGGK